MAGTRHGMPRKRKRREGREAEAEGPGDGGGGPGGSLGQRLVRARSGGEVLRLAKIEMTVAGAADRVVGLAGPAWFIQVQTE